MRLPFAVTSAEQCAIDTLATESFDRPVLRARNNPLPGAAAQRRLLVRGHADDGGHAAAVERVALHHDDRAAEPRPRARGVRQIRPTDVALCHYHSVRCRMRRAAAESAGSGRVSSVSQTRFIASVIASESWRATYSATASV